jgi:hypothetical protein
MRASNSIDIKFALTLVNNDAPFGGAKDAQACDCSPAYEQCFPGLGAAKCGGRQWRGGRRSCRRLGAWHIIRSGGCERPALLCAGARLRRARSRVCGADLLLDSRRPGLGRIPGYLVPAAHSGLRLNRSTRTNTKNRAPFSSGRRIRRPPRRQTRNIELICKRAGRLSPSRPSPAGTPSEVRPLGPEPVRASRR